MRRLRWLLKARVFVYKHIVPAGLIYANLALRLCLLRTFTFPMSCKIFRLIRLSKEVKTIDLIVINDVLLTEI